jgi:acetylornithine/succinyldiaminopimelate/putrescine aminotransferase
MLNDQLSPALLPVYDVLPVRIVAGRGSWLIDEQGHEWLDAYGGHAVAATGHCHPRIVEAITQQANELLFYSTVLRWPPREQLAEQLIARLPRPLDRVFFCNSGAEANENALHLARRATERRTIVTVTGGWHGRTAATLALCDGEIFESGAIRAGVELSRRAQFDDIGSLTACVDASVAAVVVEPVQGMAGARACSREFLQAMRTLCDRYGAALIFDEVQCGVGRTGCFTAAESLGVTPDIMTLAKGLGSGFPIAATVASSAICSSIRVGDLGSTFGGGPLACAAALATLEVIERERLLENVRRVSDQLRRGVEALGLGTPQGLGLLLGVRVPSTARESQRRMLAQRVLTGTSSDRHVMRWMPPLNFRSDEAERLVAALAGALHEEN